MNRAERHPVEFTVRLQWQDQRRQMQQVSARCTDLSASGLKLEMQVPVEVRTMVLVSCEQFGRMGLATVRYCRREGMKYSVGLQFSVQLALSDRSRQEMLGKVVAAAGERNLEIPFSY